MSIAGRSHQPASRPRPWRFWRRLHLPRPAMRSRPLLLRVGPVVVDWRLTTRDLDAIDADDTARGRADDDGMAIAEGSIAAAAPSSTDGTFGATALPHATGTVRWYDATKGHGFVTCDAGGPDCFLDQSAICAEDVRLIEEGTRVAFDVLQGLGGPLTLNVRRLHAAGGA